MGKTWIILSCTRSPHRSPHRTLKESKEMKMTVVTMLLPLLLLFLLAREADSCGPIYPDSLGPGFTKTQRSLGQDFDANGGMDEGNDQGVKRRRAMREIKAGNGNKKSSVIRNRHRPMTMCYYLSLNQKENLSLSIYKGI